MVIPATRTTTVPPARTYQVDIPHLHAPCACRKPAHVQVHMGDGAIPLCGVCWARLEKVLMRRGHKITYTASATLRLNIPWLPLVQP